MAYIGTQPKDVRSFGRAKFDFTATQGQTAFTGADDDSKTLGFTNGQIKVYVNGILMDESDFTTSNGNTVTLASAANLNDVISIVAMQTDIPNSDYVPASGGTFTGNVTHSGTLAASTISGNVSVTGDTTFGTNTNLLSNAEFTTNTTGWAATGSTLAIVSNELQLTPGAGVNGFANQQLDNLVIGKSYIASVTVTVDAASYSRLYIGTSANGNQTLATYNIGTGTHSFIFTATATTHHFALVVGGGTGQVTRFDNAKLIEANDITFSAKYGKINGILAVDRESSDGAIIDVQKDGTSVGTVGSYLGTYLYMGSTGGTDTHINFVNGNVRPATAAGAHLDNSLDLGHASSRWKDLYLSGGVYIGGTGAVNKLDDYEEGSFTPVLSWNTPSNGSVSYQARTATYIRVGRAVTIHLEMRLNIVSQNSASLPLLVSGFPFNFHNTGGYGGSLMQVSLQGFVFTASHIPFGWGLYNSDKMYLYTMSSNASNNNLATPGNYKTINVSGTYITPG